MRRTISMIAAAVLAGGLLAPVAASAGHPENDTNDCRGTIGGMYVDHDMDLAVPELMEGPMIPINDPNAGPFYLDIREVASKYWTFSLWLYQEDNGRSSLQRGGRSLFPDTPATTGVERCTPPGTPDTAIF